MVDIDIRNGRVIVDVRGWSRVWSLTSRLEFPLASVRAVRADPTVARGLWKGIRLPGTHVPGLIIAGSFRRGGEWHFWDVRSGARAIVITLEGERYDKLIVEVDDPAAMVTRLRTAIAAGGTEAAAARQE